MERRANEIPPEVIERVEGHPVIAGIASVAYDGTDRTEFVLRAADEKLGTRKVVERIMPGAFDGVVESADVRVLRNHHPDNLLGRNKSGTAEVYVDDRQNLAYKLDAPDTQVGRDTVEMLRRGDLSGSSFAFTVAEESFKDEDEVRAVEITRVENLYDVGPVTYPAYQQTSAGIRSGDPQSVLRRFEEWEKAHEEEAEVERIQRLKNRHATIKARATLAGGLPGDVDS